MMKSNPELLSLAMGLHQQGLIDKAEPIYRRMLEHEPDNADVLNLLGVIETQRKHFDEAVKLIETAVRLKPDHPVPQLNLGTAYRGQKRFIEAKRCYEKAVRLKPDFVEAHYNLGLTRTDLKDIPGAIDAMNRAIRFNPGYLDAALALAELHRKNGNTTRGAVVLEPLMAASDLPCITAMKIGLEFVKLGIPDKAEICFTRAVAADPADAEAANVLGLFYYNQGRLLDSLANLEKSTQLSPTLGTAWHNMAAALLDLGSPKEAELCFSRVIESSPHEYHSHSYLCYCLNFMHDRPAEAIFEAHTAWAAQHAQGLPHIEVKKALPGADGRRLKIGYVSEDFRVHSVAYFMDAILAHHDHTRFEIFCYSDVESPDTVTNRYKTLADVWHETVELTDEDLAGLIADDRIDILVDLAGHTRRNRLLVFARKPAAVQVTYLGYPNTTGLSTVDYRITDAIADPVGTTEQLHTEKLFRLPGSFLCYTLPDELPAIAAAPHLEKGYITFGCFNNMSKVSPVTISLWRTILQEFPGSHLLLKARPFNDPRVADRWKSLFVTQGIEPERLEFVGRIMAIEGHLALYNNVDIALDTFPYNGTTTTFEALSMGVPVVSLAGRVHASRVGASILSNIGLPELCTESEEAYIGCAVALAGSPDRLAHFRTMLRQRLKESVCCDGARFTKELEAAYETMIKGYSPVS